MNCDEIKYMISDYLDGELSKEKESFLFTHLSKCTDCREDFKVQNSIQNQTKTNMKEVPESFEKKLFAGIEAEERSFAKANQHIITKSKNTKHLFTTGITLGVSAFCTLIIIYFFSFSSRLQNLTNNSYSTEIKTQVEVVFEYGFEKQMDEIELQLQHINSN